MDLIQAIILGIIQGITEFLPISSSGHLILIPYIFNWDLQDLEFDIMLHFGTALALLIFFRKDWINMSKSTFNDVKSRKILNKDTLSTETKLLFTIILVSIPVAIAGLFLEDYVKHFFRSPVWVSTMLISIAVLMYFADLHTKKLKKNDLIKNTYKVSFITSLMISLSQIIAMIPGTSRSGITMSVGQFKNLSRETAAKFSFLLSTPLILGAGLIQIKDLTNLNQSDMLIYLTGFLSAFITGILVIKWLLNYLKNKDLKIFIIYRILLGVFVLIYFYF